MATNQDRAAKNATTKENKQYSQKSVLSGKDFERMSSQLKEETEAREQIILATRELTKKSKEAIYSVHRSEFNEAARSLQKIQAQIDWLGTKIKRYPAFADNAKPAFEEYAEACCFLGVMRHKSLPTSIDLGIDTESYLLGLCDLSGEVMREAVIAGTKGDIDEVSFYQQTVDELFGEFIKFDMRNGELRKKADSIKWNLLKIEQVLYDLKMRKQM